MGNSNMLPGFTRFARMQPLSQLVILWIVAPFGYIYFLRPLVEGRFLLPHDEWLGFWFDALLAVAIVSGGIIARRNPVILTASARVRLLLHLLVLAIFAAGAWWHMKQEAAEFTPGMRRSFTAIYHTLLYPFLGYLLVFMCLIPVIAAGWRSLSNGLLSLVAAGCIAAYVWAVVVYDKNHPLNPEGIHKTKLAHVDNWAPWNHKYHDFWPSLKRLGDWFWRLLSS